ncbi:hypothetical protein [Nannocystis bainbridge]|uniref:Uncharacterized protein n=1 Tax=Nannocystis bainbridge TaxID=2995303 RepID=A0ABT5DU23_9BACT|nr:hypothetical protein [Nannocystis bainbridge]MDC0717131.1 hypothetical protein [Nannocystis bainbridge]
MRAPADCPRVAGTGAVVVPFVRDCEPAWLRNHEPAAELVCFDPDRQLLCEFAGSAAGEPRVRVTVVPEVGFAEADEADALHSAGLAEEAEILAGEPNSPLWLRIREPLGRSTRLMPLSGQRRMPWALGRTVTGYALADGAVLALETESWRNASQLVIAHPSGRVERRALAETGTIRGGWLFGAIAEATVLRMFARRVGAAGVGPRVELGLVPATSPGVYPCQFHLRTHGEASFLAIEISHGPETPQVATAFCRAGQWSPLALHNLDSLDTRVAFSRGAGRVLWKDDNMFSGTGSRDIVELTTRPEGTARVERHPPLPASDYLDFTVLPLGDRVLALSLAESGLTARLAPLVELGRAEERALVDLPDGLWSFTAHARGEHAIVILRESEARCEFAVRIDADFEVRAVAPFE